MSESVTVSLVTNGLIMGSKLFGYVVTGSPTLFAETIHSGADVINQLLLLVGEVKSRKQSTKAHPFGYGKEKFFWALVASISVLFLGCGVTIRHGIESLYHAEPGAPFSALIIGLLLFSGFLEGYTLWIAWREIGGRKGLRAAKENTTVLAVLLENAIGVLGIAATLVVALWSTLVGPAPVMDACIAIGIGFILGAMALVLAKLNKEVLIDVADVDIDDEIEREIEKKSGLRLEVTSTMIDSSRCLLFVHVFPGDIPSNVDFTRLAEVGELIKDHVKSMQGKTVEHVYWKFLPSRDSLALYKRASA